MTNGTIDTLYVFVGIGKRILESNVTLIVTINFMLG